MPRVGSVCFMPLATASLTGWSRVKQIKDNCLVDEASRNRLIAEAEITGGLEHPGIVPVYSLGADQNQRPFYAMRLIRGQSLKEAIESFHKIATKTDVSNSISLRELLSRFIDVCNAVAYAHSRGVIHRDLKPANIMLGPFGETLVVDWGLAKATGRVDEFETPEAGKAEAFRLSNSGTFGSTTIPGSPMGTPAYMSPEQSTGDLTQIGPLTDVYGLGATLYTLLTGQPPIETRNVNDAIERVREGKIVPVQVANSTAPKPLAAICHRAMAVDSGDRYQTPLALADDLEKWLADEPVTAYQDPLSTRAWRTIRKHKTLASVASVILVLGMFGASIGSVVLGRKNIELAKLTNEAESRLDQAVDSYDGYVKDLNQQILDGANLPQPLLEFMLDKPKKFYEQLAEELSSKPNPSEREQTWLHNPVTTWQLCSQHSDGKSNRPNNTN